MHILVTSYEHSYKETYLNWLVATILFNFFACVILDNFNCNLLMVICCNQIYLKLASFSASLDRHVSCITHFLSVDSGSLHNGYHVLYSILSLIL